MCQEFRMSIQHVALAALFCAGIASAQTPAPENKNETFDFRNKPTPQGLQEIATILRTVGDIRNLTVDSSAATLSVQGTSDQVTMAAWILHNLDQPADVPPAAMPLQQFLVP